MVGEQLSKNRARIVIRIQIIRLRVCIQAILLHLNFWIRKVLQHQWQLFSIFIENIFHPATKTLRHEEKIISLCLCALVANCIFAIKVKQIANVYEKNFILIQVFN